MDTVIRISFFYLVIWLGLRILGKREFSKLSSLEMVLLLTIPPTVAQALMRGDYSVTNALIGLTTLFSLVFLNSVVKHKSRRLEEFIAGRPTVLVHHGAFIPENMDKERVSAEEIYEEMRRENFEEIRQIKWAILEPDGKISFVPEKEK